MQRWNRKHWCKKSQSGLRCRVTWRDRVQWRSRWLNREAKVASNRLKWVCLVQVKYLWVESNGFFESALTLSAITLYLTFYFVLLWEEASVNIFKLKTRPQVRRNSSEKFILISNYFEVGLRIWGKVITFFVLYRFFLLTAHWINWVLWWYLILTETIFFWLP